MAVTDLAVEQESSPPRAEILDGRALAKTVRRDLQARIGLLRERAGVQPGLAVMLVGDQPDSVLYAQTIVRWFERLGLRCDLSTLPDDAAQEDVLAEVRHASGSPEIHGLLVQMPLPAHISSTEVFQALDPLKDVEGLHPENIGRLASGKPRFVPSTPLAGMELLRARGVDLAGKHAVVLGRSNVVGKPLAHLMLQEDASVTILHSRSRDVEEYTRRADILAVAVGRPGLVTGEMIKPGAVVLDFGTNVEGESVVGDVAFEEAAQVASLITPVPGGIGPLTNLMLARNLLEAVELRVGDAGVA